MPCRSLRQRVQRRDARSRVLLKCCEQRDYATRVLPPSSYLDTGVRTIRARAADRRSERVSPSSSRSPRGSCTRRARTPQPAQGALIRLIVNVVLLVYVGGWCDAHDAPPRSSLGPRSSSAVLARKLAREGGSGGEEEAHRHPHRAVRHRDCR